MSTNFLNVKNFETNTTIGSKKVFFELYFLNGIVYSELEDFIVLAKLAMRNVCPAVRRHGVNFLGIFTTDASLNLIIQGHFEFEKTMNNFPQNCG